jgi:uncharacterized protein YqeY
MTLEKMLNAKVVAMKNGDMTTKNVLTNMIDACQKAAITPKGRVEVTEQLVDEVLIKYQKTIQEMIDTCPAARADLMEKYVAEMAIVKAYAPQLITDKGEIERMINDILNGEIPLVKSSRGTVMKLITPHFKGKADMKIVSEVVGGMLV